MKSKAKRGVILGYRGRKEEIRIGNTLWIHLTISVSLEEVWKADFDHLTSVLKPIDTCWWQIFLYLPACKFKFLGKFEGQWRVEHMQSNTNHALVLETKKPEVWAFYLMIAIENDVLPLKGPFVRNKDIFKAVPIQKTYQYVGSKKRHFKFLFWHQEEQV